MGLKPVPKTQTRKEQKWMAESVSKLPFPHPNDAYKPKCRVFLRNVFCICPSIIRTSCKKGINKRSFCKPTQSPIWQNMYTNKKVMVWCLLFIPKCGSPHFLFLKILFANVAHSFLVIAKYLGRSNPWLIARGYLKNGMHAFLSQASAPTLQTPTTPLKSFPCSPVYLTISSTNSSNSKF